MKFFKTLKMKLLKWYFITAIIAGLSFLFSCNKEEPTAAQIIEEHRRQTSEQIETENRTGGHARIFADSTGVIFSTDPADSTQEIINLLFVDSIHYTAAVPNQDLAYNGIYCWLYDITFFYEDGTTKQVQVFAKYRGVNYKQYPGINDGIPVDFYYCSFTRTNQFLTDFNYHCFRLMRKYLYKLRKTKPTGTTMEAEYIPSSICTTSIINLKRLFKA